MNHHTRQIIEQIAQHSKKIPDSKKDEIFRLLSNPDNTLSGDFFELHNQKEIATLLGNKEHEQEYENKIKEFFAKLTQYTADDAKEMASGDFKCTFANSADLIEWLEDNCEDWGYGFEGHIPLTLQANEYMTGVLFDTRNEDVDTLIHDWITYKALKHFFLELSKIFTRGAFDSASLITLLKSDMLDKKINKVYKQLVDYVEYKARTPKQQHKYVHATNDDIAKQIVDKDIEAIQEIMDYGEYNIFEAKKSDIDPAIAGLLSDTNTKYISLLKKIIGLHNQAEENDIYLQTVFPLSKKVFKGTPITQILLRHYTNNYGEQRANITNLFLDIQQQEMLLRGRLQGHMPL